ncbi:hypothetical protein JCM19297_1944 [Nonlabens ulvanivorans]|nr:hypothetical protein [Nonlabens ulvanivorans]GAK90628.1 hypothetical protein JCM19297_1944 [Nonlabens ulvanivorans]
MNQFVTYLLLLLFVSVSNAQTDQLKGFKDYYPISVRPEASIGLGNNPYEQILLELLRWYIMVSIMICAVL